MGGNKPETQRAYFEKWKQDPDHRKRLSALQREWRQRNAESERRRNDIRRCAKYGMTLEDFDALLLFQGGVCAVCKRPESMKSNGGTGRLRRLVIDHDHETGKVRGLLCSGCNTGIGLLEDNAEFLEQAVEYLRAAKSLV